MTTIRTWISERAAADAEARIADLQRLRAPAIVIDQERRKGEAARAGQLEFKGEIALLDEEFENVQVSKGRGGKPVLLFNGRIYYFPKARFGRFVSSK